VLKLRPGALAEAGAGVVWVTMPYRTSRMPPAPARPAGPPASST